MYKTDLFSHSNRLRHSLITHERPRVTGNSDEEFFRQSADTFLPSYHPQINLEVIDVKAPFLIGRLLFAGFFISSGINHLKKRKEMAEYARAKGVPQPELAVTLSAVPLLLGGASLALGVKPKLGAVAILGFLAGVSPVMHDFWRNEDPQERQTNMIMFLKNLALAGGALALAGVEEPWEASVPVGKPTLGDKARSVRRKLVA
jgi:uncharacterized membrane protein YphA (DoxX/SURF4 family)